MPFNFFNSSTTRFLTRAFSTTAWPGTGKAIDFNRLNVVHDNFIRALQFEQFPQAVNKTTVQEAGLTEEKFKQLFKHQLESFYLDKKSRELAADGEGKYTMGSAGHEGNVVVGDIFTVADPFYLHYRSGALVMAHTQKYSDKDPILDCLANYVCASKTLRNETGVSNTVSGGRHKVWGDLDLNIKPQTSTIASHLPKALAESLMLAKYNKVIAENLPQQVIFASTGDASFNHTVAQGIINLAGYHVYNNFPVPLVWMVENNGRGISTQTPAGFIGARMGYDPHWEYIIVDGLHLPDAYLKLKQAREYALLRQRPVLVEMRTIRLGGHAGPDNEVAYRPLREIEAEEAQDPKLHTVRIGIEAGFLTAQEALDMTEEVIAEIEAKTQIALGLPKLKSAEEIKSAIIPKPNLSIQPHSVPSLNIFKKTLDKESRDLNRPLDLSQCINLALTELMLQYPQMILFGEDVAGDKGGVYSVTKNLTKRFGLARVFNSLLDETSILAYAQACAQKQGASGKRLIPVPEIQFLAYLDNALDQLTGEACTAAFFSDGNLATPMLIRIAGLGCHPFGGHFHGKNSWAALREIPGLIVMCASNGEDAVHLLREAMRLIYEENRMVVFIEPIALYKVTDLLNKDDKHWASRYPVYDAKKPGIKLGEVKTQGSGKACVILTYGNGLYRSVKARNFLIDEHSVDVKLVDLCWLHPLPWEAILKEIKGYDNILIVDECRKTGSLSEEIIACLNDEAQKGLEYGCVDRIIAEDSFIPLGNAAEYLFPQPKEITQRVLEMLNSTPSPSL